MLVALAVWGRPTEAELAFVRELGVRRAQDLFPLDALMQGVRAGHRVLWKAVTEETGSNPDGTAAAVALTERLIEYTDSVCFYLERSYVETQRLLADRGELARRQFLDDALSGRLFSHVDAAQRAAVVGFLPDATYVVAAVGLRDAAAVDAGIEVVREAYERRAALDGRPPFVTARDAEVLVAVPASNSTRVKAMVQSVSAGVADRWTRHVVAGIGAPCRGLWEIARATEGALVALRYARRFGGVVAIDEIDVFSYLVSSADPFAVGSASGALSGCSTRTLCEAAYFGKRCPGYVEQDLNVIRVAESLGVHPNTVRNRLARISELTGLDMRYAREVIELHTALEITAAWPEPDSANRSAL